MDKRWSTDNGHLKWDSKKYGIATIRLLVKFIGIYWDILFNDLAKLIMAVVL